MIYCVPVFTQVYGLYVTNNGSWSHLKSFFGCNNWPAQMKVPDCGSHIHTKCEFSSTWQNQQIPGSLRPILCCVEITLAVHKDCQYSQLESS